MLQSSHITSLAKYFICIQIFITTICSNQVELSAQENTSNEQGNLPSAATVLGEIYSQHLGLIEKSESSESKVASLKVIISLVEGNHQTDEAKLNELFELLIESVGNARTDPGFAVHALSELPQLTLKTKLEGDKKDEEYEILVNTLLSYIADSSNEYDSAWGVSKSFNEGLQNLDINITGSEETNTNATSTVKRRGYSELTRGLQQIVLNDKIDIQIRYNAVKALEKQGEKFKAVLVGSDTDAKDKIDQTCFYIIISRLNEIMLNPSVPSLIKRQASAALNNFLKLELP